MSSTDNLVISPTQHVFVQSSSTTCCLVQEFQPTEHKEESEIVADLALTHVAFQQCNKNWQTISGEPGRK